MTMLLSISCYNEVCYKGTALYYVFSSVFPFENKLNEKSQ